MTVEEFISHTRRSTQRSSRKRGGLRRGQCAYNDLYVVRPDLAHKINGTAVDPFYLDDRLDTFYAWLRTNWGSDD